jgi:hypothetical protein
MAWDITLNTWVSILEPRSSHIWVLLPDDDFSTGDILAETDAKAYP